jgi:hypothetical protein
MWDVLKPTDLEEAQRQLNERRAETLRRQAEEFAALEADNADLEALDRLAAAPVRKKPDLPVIQHQPVSPRPHSRHSEKRNLSGTNFEVFSRAVSKSGF